MMCASSAACWSAPCAVASLDLRIDRCCYAPPCRSADNQAVPSIVGYLPSTGVSWLILCLSVTVRIGVSKWSSRTLD
ncbi:hypothetical protein CC79DRAFT_1332328 [Sarocladium strictum]